MKRSIFLSLCAIGFLSFAFALEQADEAAIRTAIENLQTVWNERGGKGAADYFAEDATFVNIFGTNFVGKTEIEKRHIEILGTFLKGSTLHITNSQLREVQPGLVIGLIDWEVEGFRRPGMSGPGETKSGVFTQVFVKKGEKWEIAASQNTMRP